MEEKGLNLARTFFLEWGLPAIEREFPGLSSRVAAARLAGSDVLGADDEISHDHGWGPQFWLYLPTDEEYHQFGNELSERLNAVAPNQWRGYRVAGAGERSVYVSSIPCLMQGFALQVCPKAPRDWTPADAQTPKALPNESLLYFLRHGAVFHDPQGELSAWRESLHAYPRDIWLRRLAEETFRIWHHGEYNFVQRMARRRDPIAIQVCLGEFTAGVMRLWLLLAGDFTPYWKWLAHEFRKAPEAARIEPLLMRLAVTQDIGEQVELVQDICRIAHERLLTSGLVTGKGVSPVAEYLLPLLNDYEELVAAIEDHFWRP